MKYLNAKTILPDALVKELQNYIQGGYLYIPVKQEQQKRWGEVSGYRQELAQRNRQIKRDYQDGVSMDRICEKYNLCHTENHIPKINDRLLQNAN